MTYDETVVAIFTKAPIPGNVKSRLAADIGDQAAATLYRYCAEHIIWNVRHSGLDNVVFIDLAETLPAFHDWVGGALAVQTGDSLGERMQNAVSEMVGHGYERVIIVGTDVPFLGPEIIREAATLLMTHDVVIGPAFDGGYYLIGTNGVRPQLFQDITWSSSTVLEETLDVCAKYDWSVGELDPLRDVDTKSDLDEAMKEAPQGHEDFVRHCHLVLHHIVTG